MKKKNNLPTIIITGDVTIDWNIARLQRADISGASVWDAGMFSRAFCQAGGSCLISGLVAQIARNLKKSRGLEFDISGTSILQEQIKPDNEALNHAYAIWEPFNRDSTEEGKKHRVWRVRDFLGTSRVKSGFKNPSPELTAEIGRGNPSVILLDDASLGFRDHEELWPKRLLESANTRVILKIASPVTQSRLLDYLLDHCAQKLTVIVTAGDLRQSHIHMSRGLSWERTAQDLLWEFRHNPTLNRLACCANTVISFYTAGVILLSPLKTSSRRTGVQASLFFNPNSMEDRWGQDYKGGVIGFTSCLAAAVMRQYMVDFRQPDINFAIHSGVNAMRLLKKNGYGEVDLADPAKTGPAFPVAAIAAQLEQNVSPLAIARIADPEENAAKPWTILEDRYKDEIGQVARDIVWKGFEKVISGVPVYRFGDLISIDRQEIEALNNVHSLITEYFQGSQAKPISIAVFGAPGSGKSFSITQMAKGIARDQLAPVTFNLSQFNGTKDLIDAFHQVRDISLSGRLPQVFWDEFDAAPEGRELGWLRYFLAPMQDGVFQDGQITHPIGRSIFVFAGGICVTMREFEEKQNVTDKNVKLTDFISRLKGFLNITGINPGGDTDYCCVMRRAIAFRKTLEKLARPIVSGGNEKRADVDESVINAFLLTREYKHGIRSMESIVAMSQISNKMSFEKSYLPTESQLAMHVEAGDFGAILQRTVIDPAVIEKMAEGMHGIYLKRLKEEKYTFGSPPDDAKKISDALVPYAELREDLKEQNRDMVRDISHKLSLIGYTLQPALSGKGCDRFTEGEIESLGKKEHERWMREKLARGFTLGEDRTRMQNPYLEEWSKLSDAVKERDRRFIRGIPEILAKNGYAMVKNPVKLLPKGKKKAAG